MSNSIKSGLFVVSATNYHDATEFLAIDTASAYPTMASKLKSGYSSDLIFFDTAYDGQIAINGLTKHFIKTHGIRDIKVCAVVLEPMPNIDISAITDIDAQIERLTEERATIKRGLGRE